VSEPQTNGVPKSGREVFAFLQGRGYALVPVGERPALELMWQPPGTSRKDREERREQVVIGNTPQFEEEVEWVEEDDPHFAGRKVRSVRKTGRQTPIRRLYVVQGVQPISTEEALLRERIADARNLATGA
jgi:hypothetical protein